jgi:alkylated DNA repair dioxygenase AlkB
MPKTTKSKISVDGKTAYQFYDSLYIPNFIENPTEIFEELNEEINWLPRSNFTFKIFGHIFNLPRDKAFQGDNMGDDFRPLYRYGDDYLPKVVDFTKKAGEIRDKLEKKFGVHNNHMVANRYINGKDHIGFHVDKVRDFVPGSKVYTVSFGEERVFRMKKMPSKRIEKLEGYEEEKIKEKEEIFDVILKPGSLFIIGPKTNTFYKHSIVKTGKKNVGTRISLTIRNIKTQYKINKDGKLIIK